MRSTIISTLVSGGLALALCGPALPQPVLAAARDVPQVKADGKAVTLELPDALQKELLGRFPEWRVPAPADLTDDWKRYAASREVPYSCWGDFNGDGMIDVALLLLGPGGWRLSAFLKAADGSYQLVNLGKFPGKDSEFIRDNPPQRFRLVALGKGSKFIDQGKRIFTSTSRFDSIVFSLVTDSKSLIHYQWNPDHKFFSVSAMGDLTD